MVKQLYNIILPWEEHNLLLTPTVVNEIIFLYDSAHLHAREQKSELSLTQKEEESSDQHDIKLEEVSDVLTCTHIRT